MRTALALGAVVFAVWVVCEPTFDYGFAYDDHAVIVDRPAAWEDGWSSFFAARAWGVTRHASLLSLDLDRRTPLTPRPFRVTNAALAAANAALVLALGCALGLTAAGALMAGLLFALHPAHVDAVVSIVGRAELLAATGVLIAVTLHARAYGGRAYLTILAGIAFLLALASKESAACLPALLLAFEVCRPKGHATFPGDRDLARPRLWPLVYVIAGALWLAFAANKFASVDPIVFADNPLASSPAFERILGAGEVLWKYAAASIWPFDLKPDLGYAEVTTSFAGGIAAWAGWAFVAFGALALRRRDPLSAFAIVWLPAAFAVTGNVVMPIGTLMAERLLYLPTVGVCLLAGRAFEATASSSSARKWARAAGVAVVLLALLASFQQRARVWADDEHYHEQAAALSPRSAKAHFNLGLSYARRERYADAELSFGRALAIVPAFAAAAGYRAEALRRLGRTEEALAVYRAYLGVAPEDLNALRAASALAEATGQPDEALAYLRRGIDLAPDDGDLRNALIETEARARAAGQLSP